MQKTQNCHTCALLVTFRSRRAFPAYEVPVVW